jgi:hypothetical protein
MVWGSESELINPPTSLGSLWDICFVGSECILLLVVMEAVEPEEEF